MKLWFALAAAAVVAGCVPVERDLARDVIGVSAATGTQSAPDAAPRELLAWKASRICTIPG